ncbi:PX domain-containing protein [Giardia muris]|uniref:PX domain-containing protein n=1 Tax=Giardia muris TaxID=5742 RepID=A0A4Z1T605_GIAMU|nr:PX domain-containing protein [Giardia muris]|eukprot:TNJ28567.1 PX domain-containing protein [Giardia muris]
MDGYAYDNYGDYGGYGDYTGYGDYSGAAENAQDYPYGAMDYNPYSLDGYGYGQGATTSDPYYGAVTGETQPDTQHLPDTYPPMVEPPASIHTDKLVEEQPAHEVDSGTHNDAIERSDVFVPETHSQEIEIDKPKDNEMAKDYQEAEKADEAEKAEEADEIPTAAMEMFGFDTITEASAPATLTLTDLPPADSLFGFGDEFTSEPPPPEVPAPKEEKPKETASTAPEAFFGLDDVSVTDPNPVPVEYPPSTITDPFFDEPEQQEQSKPEMTSQIAPSDPGTLFGFDDPAPESELPASIPIAEEPEVTDAVSEAHIIREDSEGSMFAVPSTATALATDIANDPGTLLFGFDEPTGPTAQTNLEDQLATESADTIDADETKNKDKVPEVVEQTADPGTELPESIFDFTVSEPATADTVPIPSNEEPQVQVSMDSVPVIPSASEKEDPTKTSQTPASHDPVDERPDDIMFGFGEEETETAPISAAATLSAPVDLFGFGPSPDADADVKSASPEIMENHVESEPVPDVIIFEEKESKNVDEEVPVPDVRDADESLEDSIGRIPTPISFGTETDGMSIPIPVPIVNIEATTMATERVEMEETALTLSLAGDSAVDLKEKADEPPSAAPAFDLDALLHATAAKVGIAPAALANIAMTETPDFTVFAPEDAIGQSTGLHAPSAISEGDDAAKREEDVPSPQTLKEEIREPTPLPEEPPITQEDIEEEIRALDSVLANTYTMPVRSELHQELLDGLSQPTTALDEIGAEIYRLREENRILSRKIEDARIIRKGENVDADISENYFVGLLDDDQEEFGLQYLVSSETLTSDEYQRIITALTNPEGKYYDGALALFTPAELEELQAGVHEVTSRIQQIDAKRTDLVQDLKKLSDDALAVETEKIWKQIDVAEEQKLRLQAYEELRRKRALDEEECCRTLLQEEADRARAAQMADEENYRRLQEEHMQLMERERLAQELRLSEEEERARAQREQEEKDLQRLREEEAQRRRDMERALAADIELTAEKAAELDKVRRAEELAEFERRRRELEEAAYLASEEKRQKLLLEKERLEAEMAQIEELGAQEQGLSEDLAYRLRKAQETINAQVATNDPEIQRLEAELATMRARTAAPGGKSVEELQAVSLQLQSQIQQMRAIHEDALRKANAKDTAEDPEIERLRAQIEDLKKKVTNVEKTVRRETREKNVREARLVAARKKSELKTLNTEFAKRMQALDVEMHILQDKITRREAKLQRLLASGGARSRYDPSMPNSLTTVSASMKTTSDLSEHPLLVSLRKEYAARIAEQEARRLTYANERARIHADNEARSSKTMAPVHAPIPDAELQSHAQRRRIIEEEHENMRRAADMALVDVSPIKPLERHTRSIVDRWRRHEEEYGAAQQIAERLTHAYDSASKAMIPESPEDERERRYIARIRRYTSDKVDATYNSYREVPASHVFEGTVNSCVKIGSNPAHAHPTRFIVQALSTTWCIEGKRSPYVLYTFLVSTEHGVFEVSKRYSELKELSGLMAARFSAFSLAPFPTDKVHGRPTDAQVEARKQALERYLTSLNDITAIRTSKEYIAFLKTETIHHVLQYHQRR